MGSLDVQKDRRGSIYKLSPYVSLLCAISYSFFSPFKHNSFFFLGGRGSGKKLRSQLLNAVALLATLQDKSSKFNHKFLLYALYEDIKGRAWSGNYLGDTS